MLDTLKKRLLGLNIQISFTKEAVDAVADAGFDEIYGARPLKRAIQTNIEDMLSERMLDGSVKAGEELLCDFKDGKFTI